MEWSYRVQEINAGDKQLIHGNEERVAEGTYQESGCHFHHDKLKLIKLNSADRTTVLLQTVA